jgi:FixJ family two-component response regulator
MQGAPVVCIVDDDESVRESLTGLLRSTGYAARPFASAEDFLAHFETTGAACAVVDVTMPGLSGADLQELLLARHCTLPLIFITARTEPGLHARLLERGALACLVKPFHEDDLLDAVETATRAEHRPETKDEP